jgi:hypothetical protein
LRILYNSANFELKFAGDEPFLMLPNKEESRDCRHHKKYFTPKKAENNAFKRLPKNKNTKSTPKKENHIKKGETRAPMVYNGSWKNNPKHQKGGEFHLWLLYHNKLFLSGLI